MADIGNWTHMVPSQFEVNTRPFFFNSNLWDFLCDFVNPFLFGIKILKKKIIFMCLFVGKIWLTL